ncbi:uncharacterized protein [Cicer arietinum]|uniref:uncharacterized protein n=1 Tax=Cicer arietinum TaxID=3827 RepID=UPI00032AA4B8
MTRDEALRQLKYHLGRAQQQMIKFANCHRKPTKIKEGDWAYLKIRPHRQVTMPTRLHPKLAAKYYGPYLVLKQIGTAAFKFQLPTEARIHPVFHALQLKLDVGKHEVETSLPIDLHGQDPAYTPSQVLGRRTIQQQGEQVQQVLIQWQQKPAEEATWEDVNTIQNQFPEFNLKDKVELEGEGIDRNNEDVNMNKPLLVYYRKKQ